MANLSGQALALVRCSSVMKSSKVSLTSSSSGATASGALGSERFLMVCTSPYGSRFLGLHVGHGINVITEMSQKCQLVGGFKHDFYFPFHIWDI